MPFPPPIRKQLERLPRSGATWQIAQAKDPVQLADGKSGMALACAQADGIARVAWVSPDGAAATESDWCKLLKIAMENPQAPARAGLPARVQVRDAAVATLLETTLRQLKIAVAVGETPGADAACAAIAAQNGTAGGVLVLRDRDYGLYAQARLFAREKPWEWFEEQPIFAFKMPISGWSEPRGVLMGGLGHVFGLSLFTSAADLAPLIQRNGEPAADTQQLAVEFIDARAAGQTELKRLTARGLPVESDWIPIFYTVRGRTRSPLQAAAHAQVLELALTGINRWLQLHEAGSDPNQLILNDDGNFQCWLMNPEEAISGMISLDTWQTGDPRLLDEEEDEAVADDGEERG